MDYVFPKAVQQLFHVFKEQDMELYLVGGAIRDILLGKTPKDYDFATNARPEQVLTFFEKVVPTGIDYGTVTVVIDHEAYEVTTYRHEHDYDGRRPKGVSFSEHIKDDLMRRDFTINALAMDSQGNLLDEYGGRDDLRLGIVRFVGNPMERVMEDKLRLVRGIRFAAVYGFKIPTEEYDAVYKAKGDYDLSQISVERFRGELNKILISSHVKEGLRLLEETYILDAFIPELRPLVGFNQNTPYHKLDAWRHTLEVVGKLAPVLYMRLSALFHDVSKPESYTENEKGEGRYWGHEGLSAQKAVEIMKRLKYDTATILKVEHLIKNHMRKELPTQKSTQRRWVREIGKDTIFELIDLMKADASPIDPTDYEAFALQMRRLLEEEPVLEREFLALNGTDVMEAFMIRGVLVGEVLNHLLEQVLEDPTLNDKEKLLSLARCFLNHENRVPGK